MHISIGEENVGIECGVHTHMHSGQKEGWQADLRAGGVPREMQRRKEA